MDKMWGRQTITLSLAQDRADTASLESILHTPAE